MKVALVVCLALALVAGDLAQARAAPAGAAPRRLLASQPYTFGAVTRTFADAAADVMRLKAQSLLEEAQARSTPEDLTLLLAQPLPNKATSFAFTSIRANANVAGEDVAADNAAAAMSAAAGAMDALKGSLKGSLKGGGGPRAATTTLPPIVAAPVVIR